ncbi:MAG: hypothetical protein EOR45_33555 [Mesorhizobium sp.]|nr:MAG: hypothetical protein EOQ56_04775 [Mesorhizobium sp.]RWK74358.1 MAG: hypothetical protein EOR45_33555 [Mesorhizobium sp.]
MADIFDIYFRELIDACVEFDEADGEKNNYKRTPRRKRVIEAAENLIRVRRAQGTSEATDA